MAHDIRMAKLVSGEIIIGKYNELANQFDEVALMQSVPTKEGVQMMMLPYGYPFEQTFVASVDLKHVMYAYQSTPEELQNKYIEILTNISIQKSGIITN